MPNLEKQNPDFHNTYNFIGEQIANLKVEDDYTNSRAIAEFVGQERTNKARNLNIAILLNSHYSLHGSTVLEVGPCYGMLASILFASHDIKRYIMIEQDYMIKFLKDFLSKKLTPEQFAKCEFYTDLNESGKHDIDFFISSACLSEIDVETRTMILDNALSRVDSAFVVDINHKDIVRTKFNEYFDNASEREDLIPMHKVYHGSKD